MNTANLSEEVKNAGSAGSKASTSAKMVPHICVCACTYKRPNMLRRLLVALDRQQTNGLFTYSVVVSDNDETRSAESTVIEMQNASAMPIKYCVEPRRNIALARNKALENVEGEFIALIDDDEIPEPSWLLTLFNECNQFQVDGVLGPVLRHFDQEPPAWFKKSSIYVRRINPTGQSVDWKEARTGNVLMKRSIVVGETGSFRPEFRAGEDQDFFRRKIEEGCRFIWSSDAAVSETIPPARWKRSYILRKAMLQGATAALQPSCDAKNIAKSLIAVPLYLLAVPFTLLIGHQYFMSLMVKICDHSGKLLMLVGINPVKEEYVSE
jgi:succinoglycan biosynthesis protein ExoM